MWGTKLGVYICTQKKEVTSNTTNLKCITLMRSLLFISSMRIMLVRYTKYLLHINKAPHINQTCKANKKVTCV